MARRRKTKERRPAKAGLQPGAKSGGTTLRSYEVGALPMINRILQRMRLSEMLRQGLPADGPRIELPTYRGLSVLVCNILISREPIYGVGQWAARYAPDLLDLRHQQIKRLNDDRIGRCFDRLFDGLDSGLIMSVVRQVIDEFKISLDELHNDSTTVSFYGAHEDAEQEGRVRGRPTLAITFGHSKDRRPDLKQLLYVLTVTDDGGVPIYFTSANGNTTDDTTHRQTWDLLHELVGRSDFLYVADCKLASSENMNYIARKQSRFVTVLPRTRKEDQQFRKRLLTKPDAVNSSELFVKTKERVFKGKVMKQVIDRVSVCSQDMLSKEGYRLLWYHSTKKAEHDTHSRTRRLQRATRELTELRDRLQPIFRGGDIGHSQRFLTVLAARPATLSLNVSEIRSNIVHPTTIFKEVDHSGNGKPTHSTLASGRQRTMTPKTNPKNTPDTKCVLRTRLVQLLCCCGMVPSVI